jgi:NAD(P)-dependent dehydrogenase (short-subunit alcohol dehydrogenase family)
MVDIMENIVITGVTSGFGIHWLYELDKGSDITFFILARNEKKFNEMLKQKALTNAVHFITCELDSFQSIANAVCAIAALTDNVDTIINNAGVWSDNEFSTSKDHIELTLAVNHLAPYLLTGQLITLLKNSTNPRIINTASFRHKDAKVDIKDIELRENFSAEQAYCNSKLYSVLFTKKLAQLLKDTTISVNCFDPGIVDTPMLKAAFPKGLNSIYPIFRKLIARSPQKGAETGVFLSQKSICNLGSGEYYKNSKIKAVSKQGNNQALIDWLWNESIRLTGFKYVIS